MINLIYIHNEVEESNNDCWIVHILVMQIYSEHKEEMKELNKGSSQIKGGGMLLWKNWSRKRTD